MVVISAGSDIVSSYDWRGVKVTGAAFQPSLSLEVAGFSVTAWGSVDFAGTYREMDLTPGKSIPLVLSGTVISSEKVRHRCSSNPTQRNSSLCRNGRQEIFQLPARHSIDRPKRKVSGGEQPTLGGESLRHPSCKSSRASVVLDLVLRAIHRAGQVAFQRAVGPICLLDAAISTSSSR